MRAWFCVRGVKPSFSRGAVTNKDQNWISHLTLQWFKTYPSLECTARNQSYHQKTFIVGSIWMVRQLEDVSFVNDGMPQSLAPRKCFIGCDMTVEPKKAAASYSQNCMCSEPAAQTTMPYLKDLNSLNLLPD